MDKTVSPDKILIVYFSHSGNTREMARQIHETTGGELLELQPVKAYPGEYSAVVDQAKKEIQANYHPELKTKVIDINKYELIFVGSPNWWSTIAPPVASFLSLYNLSGKIIVPFITHGGGGMAHCDTDLFKRCPNAVRIKGLALNGDSVRSSKKRVKDWLTEVGIVK